VAELNWGEVRTYLQDSEAELLAEVTRARDVLHETVPGEWSVAQIVQHLVRTEQLLYPVWTVLPRLRRAPRVVRIADAANVRLWRLMGMRTMESAGARITPANAAEGRYRAPVFLRPSTGGKDADQLIEWRRRIRDRTMRAIVAVDEFTLNSMRWSHPLLGHHHLPQIRRIQESRKIAHRVQP
jgi:hypothetical protein